MSEAGKPGVASASASASASGSAPAPAPVAAADAAALPQAAPPEEPPRYWAWTDRWDPGKWETPDHPTPLQRTLAWIALVIVLVMTVYVPLKVLKFF